MTNTISKLKSAIMIGFIVEAFLISVIILVSTDNWPVNGGYFDRIITFMAFWPMHFMTSLQYGYKGIALLLSLLIAWSGYTIAMLLLIELNCKHIQRTKQ